MTDKAALAALVVAAAALIIASAQLTQQLLATAYVIRKCDRIVTGGLTVGGRRQWHWRQFRFTVKYQSLVFTLPQSVYESLGVSSTVRVDSPSKEVWDRAVKTRPSRASAQACWVSLVQDLAISDCLLPEDICIKEESGDRIPEDLTVAPMRVDSLTLLLSCIAMGMQVFKYSPTTGEITLSGGVGSISSSTHPILGGLLHYNVFSDQPTIGLSIVRRHGRALRNNAGVWANAVFGRFRDRLYRPDMVPLDELMARQFPTLRRDGWPEDSKTDTIGGAACFMAFGHVDVCDIAPPSVIRHWTAHFAEVIVKAHHVDILRNQSEINELIASGPSLLTDQHGYAKSLYEYSSPYIQRMYTVDTFQRFTLQLSSGTTRATMMLTDKSLVEHAQRLGSRGWASFGDNEQDPSAYCPIPILWGLICMIDAYMYVMRIKFLEAGYSISWLAPFMDSIVVKSISSLHAVGPPSWGNASSEVKSWPLTFQNSFDGVWPDMEQKCPGHPDNIQLLRPQVRLYAELLVLRSGYCTVMMRAAHPLGPGLVEGCNIETSMAYMA
ncbi:MAG: hypothetical protein Q9201_000953 [Fulgogasparrea decipioides]